VRGGCQLPKRTQETERHPSPNMRTEARVSKHKHASHSPWDQEAGFRRDVQSVANLGSFPSMRGEGEACWLSSASAILFGKSFLFLVAVLILGVGKRGSE
jgi:hypothetical protein